MGPCRMFNLDLVFIQQRQTLNSLIVALRPFPPLAENSGCNQLNWNNYGVSSLNTSLCFSKRIFADYGGKVLLLSIQLSQVSFVFSGDYNLQGTLKSNKTHDLLTWPLSPYTFVFCRFIGPEEKKKSHFLRIFCFINQIYKNAGL